MPQHFLNNMAKMHPSEVAAIICPYLDIGDISGDIPQIVDDDTLDLPELEQDDIADSSDFMVRVIDIGAGTTHGMTLAELFLAAGVDITNRESGEDDLGDIVGPVTVDFDAGLYYNKRLKIDISAIAVTFAATKVRRYGFVVEQNDSGDGQISFQNATWKGAAEQPTTGIGAETYYEVFYSAGTCFIHRVA